MDRKKLEKLRRELEKLRGSPQKAKAIQKLAKRLGRTPVVRGKEPTWQSNLPGRYPLSIPNHKGKDIPIGTRNSILDALENDIFAIEAKLSSNGHDKKEDGNKDA
jgi:hypothetical protein